MVEQKNRKKQRDGFMSFLLLGVAHNLIDQKQQASYLANWAPYLKNWVP